MSQWTVPFIVETTELWHVDAKNRMEATMIATQKRERGDTPSHKHQTRFQLGTVAKAVEDPDELTENAIAP